MVTLAGHRTHATQQPGVSQNVQSPSKEFIDEWNTYKNSIDFKNSINNDIKQPFIPTLKTKLLKKLSYLKNEKQSSSHSGAHPYKSEQKLNSQLQSKHVQFQPRFRSSEQSNEKQGIVSVVPMRYRPQLTEITNPSFTVAPQQPSAMVKSSRVPPPESTRMPNRLEMIRSLAALNHSLNVFIPSDPHQMPRMNRIVLPNLSSIQLEPRVYENIEITGGAGGLPTNYAPSLGRLQQPSHRLSEVPLIGNNNNILLSPFERILSTMIDNSNGVKDDQILSKIDSPEEPSLFESANHIFDNNKALFNNLESFFTSNNGNSESLRIGSNILQFNNQELRDLSDIINNEVIPDKNKENGTGDSIENSANGFTGNLDAINLYKTILQSFGLELDIENPDVDISNPKPKTTIQTTIGGKCIVPTPEQVQGNASYLLPSAR